MMKEIEVDKYVVYGQDLQLKLRIIFFLFVCFISFSSSVEVFNSNMPGPSLNIWQKKQDTVV